MAKRKAEKTKEELRKLTILPDNKFCMDCGMRGPLYVVLDFHIFVCSQCSAIHRGSQHKVKGISMSEFTPEELNGMKFGGNGVAKAVWLAGFRGSLPRDGDERAIKDHIRHIYEEKRHYDAAAAKDAASAQEQGLPPVQPMPAHILPTLEKARAPVIAPAPVVAQAPEQQAAAPVQQGVVVPKQGAAQQQPNVFDTVFQAPPPPPQQQQPAVQNHSVDPFAGIQQQQSAVSQAGSGADGMDFFNTQQSPAPQAQQNTAQVHAVQMQMHSTSYQQTGNAYGAQGQMNSHGTGGGYATSGGQPQQSNAPASMWGAQAAQVQMAPPTATTYTSGTAYAAQHQMNSSTSAYGQQQQQYPQAQAGGGMDFFAQPSAGGAVPQPQPQQYTQQQQPVGGMGSGGAVDPFFGGGPPPISAGQQRAQPAPLAGTGGPPSTSSPASKGPDPFASLDFFSKKK